MHAISHSLAQRAHRGAPPATRTRARWQPYNAIQSLSARSSPAGYLHTPASSVSSASPTPPQALTVSENDRLRNIIITPPVVSQTPREVPIRDVQKSKYVIGLVDQAVKSLCDIWHPQDIPNAFLTSSRATVTGAQGGEPLIPLITKHSINQFHSRNTQLPSPISPSTQPSPISPSFIPTHAPHQADHCIASQTNLVPIKGFVHEVLRRSRTSGSVLQTALCYLEAIRAKVPELVEKEKMGEGVQGEPDLSGKIVQGDLEAEEWRELSLDSVMADFIHMDAAVDTDSAEPEAMATVKVVDSDDAPRGASSFTSQLSTSNPDFTLSGLKSHLVQNLAKKPKVPAGPLPPLAPLPSPLLCPRRTFLASLILASKFTQDRCYSNKAWAKLSGLPPREIGRCERALGDALEWRLWVGKTPAGCSPPSSNRPVVRSKSDGELIANSGPSEARSHACFSTPPPPRQLSRNSQGAGLRRASTLPPSGFSQDPLVPAPTVPEDSWEALPWTPASVVTSVSSNDSPPTPSLSHSPSSTDSSSGDRTIQMSTFIDTTSPPSQFFPFGISDKAHPQTLDVPAAPYTYAAQPQAILDVDPTSGLSFPSYVSHGVDTTFVYDNSAGPDAMYSHWTV
jgi:hypothetical protein